MRRSALLALVAGVAHSDDALVRCDLSAESGQLAAGLAKRGASCAAFAPVGPARGGGPVCLKALPQSGSTFSELAFSRVLEDACAAEAGCRFSKTDDEARAAWRAGAPTVLAYGRKHAPIQKDCPRSVVVLRDPRFRAASHLRYREQLKRKARARADRPDRVFAWDVSFALLSEARLLRDHVLDRVGGNATALLVRYEVLADGTYGPAILRDVDAFLGLAGRRGARLPAAAARRVANDTSYAELAARCGAGDWVAAAAAPGCPATRPQELYRAHAPRSLEDLLVGGDAAGVDAALAKHRLLRGLWGCFEAPPRATAPRRPTAASCPPPRPEPPRADATAPRAAPPAPRGWQPAAA